MAVKPGIKSEIAAKVVARFPDTPSLTLAKKIYKEHSVVFKDIEDARGHIRTVRGTAGERKRKDKADKSNFKPVGHFKLNPFKLPESYADTREPYIFPIANNNILVISDLHIPYHDISAVTAAITYGKEHKVNTVLILGDLIDFHTLSRFERDPRARSAREEFDATRAFLVALRKEFPTQKIVYIKGNHCIRYEKYLYAKAPEIFDDPHYLLEERLRLNDLRIEILDDTRLIHAGKLLMSHGHLLVRGVFAPVNAARGLFTRAKTSMAIGHCHTTSEHSESNLKGDMITCWSVGCLCTLSPGYDPFNTKHNQGFAHVRTAKDGSYNFKNIRVYQGKIM